MMLKNDLESWGSILMSMASKPQSVDVLTSIICKVPVVVPTHPLVQWVYSFFWSCLRQWRLDDWTRWELTMTSHGARLAYVLVVYWIIWGYLLGGDHIWHHPAWSAPAIPIWPDLFCTSLVMWELITWHYLQVLSLSYQTSWILILSILLCVTGLVVKKYSEHAIGWKCWSGSGGTRVNCLDIWVYSTTKKWYQTHTFYC